MTMRAENLLDVLEQPASAIALLLDGGRQSADDELPDQLAFFSSFFSGGAID